MKLVIVGEAPGREPGPALEGGAALNLCRLAGWEWDDYIRGTERMNLFDTPQERWNLMLARESAIAISPLFRNRRVILLGAKVAEAFGKSACPLYEWKIRHDNSAIARIPHPSGRNRLWNDEAERTKALHFLHGLL